MANDIAHCHNWKSDNLIPSLFHMLQPVSFFGAVHHIMQESSVEEALKYMDSNNPVYLHVVCIYATVLAA